MQQQSTSPTISKATAAWKKSEQKVNQLESQKIKLEGQLKSVRDCLWEIAELANMNRADFDKAIMYNDLNSILTAVMNKLNALRQDG